MKLCQIAFALLAGCQVAPDEGLAGNWSNVDDGATLTIDDRCTYRSAAAASPSDAVAFDIPCELEREPFDTFRIRFDAQTAADAGISLDKGNALCAFCRRDGDEITCERAPQPSVDPDVPLAKSCHFMRASGVR